MNRQALSATALLLTSLALSQLAPAQATILFPINDSVHTAPGDILRFAPTSANGVAVYAKLHDVLATTRRQLDDIGVASRSASRRMGTPARPFLFVTVDALTAAKTARQQRDRADENAKTALRHLDAAHMNLAQTAWEDAHVGQTVRMLELHRPSAGEGAHFVDLRGFEWFYWNRLSHCDLLTLKGHTREVMSVAFSADGKRLASASYDQTVKVWDAATGQETLTLKGHTREVTSIAFSADAKWLASASWDESVKVWDATSGQETLTLKGHANAPCNSLASGSRRLGLRPDRIECSNSYRTQQLVVYSRPRIGRDGVPTYRP